jgi:hypothetical protein
VLADASLRAHRWFETRHRVFRARVYWRPAPRRVATRCRWARIEALLRNCAFAAEYASARERWRNGIPAVFPPGTYWLQRFASLPVLET